MQVNLAESGTFIFTTESVLPTSYYNFPFILTLHQSIPRERELGERRATGLVGERSRRLVYQPPDDQGTCQGKAESASSDPPSLTWMLTISLANERQGHTRPLRGDVLEVQGRTRIVHLKQMLQRFKYGCSSTVYDRTQAQTPLCVPPYIVLTVDPSSGLDYWKSLLTSEIA
jgi:hypothetical protein